MALEDKDQKLGKEAILELMKAVDEIYPAAGASEWTSRS